MPDLTRTEIEARVATIRENVRGNYNWAATATQAPADMDWLLDVADIAIAQMAEVERKEGVIQTYLASIRALRQKLAERKVEMRTWKEAQHRAFQQQQIRHIRNATTALRDAYEGVKSERDALASKLAESEKACLEVIDQRDHREEQVTRIYQALGGNDEWSNLHDLGDEALDLVAEKDAEIERLREIEEAAEAVHDDQDAALTEGHDREKFLASRVAELEAENAKFKAHRLSRQGLDLSTVLGFEAGMDEGKETIEGLRAALRPFAALWNFHGLDDVPASAMQMLVRIEDVRRARDLIVDLAQVEAEKAVDR